MSSYTFEYWFRYGNLEKDFETVTIHAETVEDAEREVYKIRNWIFKITQIK
jgi:hypothetical protein